MDGWMDRKVKRRDFVVWSYYLVFERVMTERNGMEVIVLGQPVGWLDD